MNIWFSCYNFVLHKCIGMQWVSALVHQMCPVGLGAAVCCCIRCAFAHCQTRSGGDVMVALQKIVISTHIFHSECVHARFSKVHRHIGWCLHRSRCVGGERACLVAWSKYVEWPYACVGCPAPQTLLILRVELDH